MTSTITFSGVESNKFDGDKTINGNLILQNGADRSIYIANAATATAGDDLTVRAGDGTGTGNRNGGDLYLHGGDAANSGTDGDTILGFVNGGAARGYVGVRMVPSVTLDITGDANLGDDSIRFSHSRSDGGIRLDNNSADGAEWYIDSTGTGSGYGTGKLAFVAGIGGTNVLTLASTAVVVGGTTAYADNGEFLEVNKSADDGGIGLFCWSTTDAERALIEFHKSASATIGTKALVANGEALGGIVWRAADSATGWSTAASIEAYIDATPGDNDTGGRLVFSTTADGAASPTQRMRIGSNGNVAIGTGASSGAQLDISGTGFQMEMFQSADSADGAYLGIVKSRGTKASPTIVQNNDRVLGLTAKAYDGVVYRAVAALYIDVDGTPGSGDMPGRLIEATTLDGASSVSERRRVDNKGWQHFTMHDNAGTPVAATGALKMFAHNKSVADDASITLPAVTTNGYGIVTADDASNRTQFVVDGTGTVTLVNNAGSVVANADTDANLCIGTAATQEPLLIKNRLAATKVINVIFWYD